jgi:hypothetical protein
MIGAVVPRRFCVQVLCRQSGIGLEITNLNVWPLRASVYFQFIRSVSIIILILNNNQVTSNIAIIRSSFNLNADSSHSETALPPHMCNRTSLPLPSLFYL